MRRYCSVVVVLLIAGIAVCQSGLQRMPEPEPGTIYHGWILLSLEPGTTIAEAKAFADKQGLEYIKAMRVPDRFIFRIPEWEQPNMPQLTREKVGALARVPGVHNPEPAMYVQKHDSIPNDSLYSQQWALTQVNMPQAWDFQKGSNTVTVVFMDDSFDLTHPDFALSPSSRLLQGYNAYDGSTDVGPEDWWYDSHGTATGSITMAATDNGVGLAGVCWQGVKFLPIRVSDEFGFMWNFITEDGYQHVIDTFSSGGLGVLNMSYGGYSSSSTEEDLLNQIRDLGVITVASAGNDRPFMLAGWPASYETVISAAATGPGGAIASYSSQGSTDRTRKVDLAAPGGDGVGPATGMLAAAMGGDYIVANGTSFSAPMITGACALLLSQGIPEDEVFEVLKDTANTRGRTVPNVDYGYGEIDVFEALRQFGGSASFITPKTNDVFEYRRIRVRARVGNLDEDTIYLTDNDQVFDYGDLVDIGDETFKEIDVTRTFTTGYHTLAIHAVSLITGQPLDPPPSITFKIQLHAQPAGTSMFAIPYAVGSSLPEQVLSGSFVLQRFVYLYDEYDRRLNDGEWARYPDARAGFHPPTAEVLKESTGADATPTGVGYFLTLNITQPINVIEGPDVDTSYLIRLRPGWQMFGNPFPFTVDWNACEIKTVNAILSMGEAVDEEYIKPQLFRWSPISLSYSWRALPSGQLYSWEGAWVYCRKSCWLRVHPVPTDPRMPTRPDSRPEIRGDGWALQLQATGGGGEDALNYIGATSEPRPAYDLVGEAPAPTDRIRLSILGPDGRTPYAQYLKDRTSRNLEWDVVVVAPEGVNEAVLEWDEIVRPSAQMAYTLVDTVTGRRLSMNAVSSYRFSADESGGHRLFKIIAVGDTAAKLVVTGVHVSSFNGRGGSSYTIHYTLSKDAQVSVTVLSPTGKQIAVLGAGSRSIGANQAVWNGRDQAGISQPPGVYLAQITATGVSGEQVRVISPIVLTR
jgi:hypothetical protein